MALDEFRDHGKHHGGPPLMSADEYLRMQVAGTVTFPATFPQLGRLSLETVTLPIRGVDKSEVFLVVEESPSLRVTLRRRIAIRYVRAIFQPRDPQHVNYNDGEWILGEEILHRRLSRSHPFGIAFVCEDAPSLLDMSAGMTAAESVQYYPPLPCDTSKNHYNPWPESGGDAHVVKDDCHKGPVSHTGAGSPVGACHRGPVAEFQAAPLTAFLVQAFDDCH